MGGFGQGLTQGLQQAQDRQMQLQHLKLQQDYSKAQQKSMETEDAMKQLQLSALQRKIEEETRLPSQMANIMGPEGAPLGPGQQGAELPSAPPEINRRNLVSFLQSASSAGQDPMAVLHLMGLADPRIKAIADSLLPKKFAKLGEGESIVEETTGKTIATGRPKAHVLPPGSTLFREGEQNVEAPAKPTEQKPIVASPGQTILMPDGQQFTIPAAPAKPMAVSPGEQLVNPETGQPIFTAPPAPQKPVAVGPGGSLVNPETGQATFTAPQAPAKPMSVAPGASVINPDTGSTIFTAPAGPAKPPDYGDRLESAAASYGQNTYGRATSFTELLAMDPIQAAKLRQQTMVDEPVKIAAAKQENSIDLSQKEILTPTEANTLGVPFGTTKGQAKGIMPLTVVQREAMAGFDAARTIIADIQQYSDKVNTTAGGMFGRSKQAMKLWGAWTQSDPDAALLMSKAGELARLARSMGEKGAMAEGDIARAAALVPSVVDTREVAQQKLKDLTSIITKGEANFMKSLGMKTGEPAKSNKAPAVKSEPADPLANIPVPQGLSKQQEKVYREAYAAERARKQQQMKPAGKAMPSFQLGTSSVPETGPAMLHQGEMVIPKQEADALRQKGFGLREDGSEKGMGFFGLLRSQDPTAQPGTFSTEISANSTIDGQDLSYPLLVPSLSLQDLTHILSGKEPTDAMHQKAIDHALARIRAGKSPFAEIGEQLPLPTR